MDRLTSLPLPRLMSVFVGLVLVVLPWLPPVSPPPGTILAAESPGKDTPEGDSSIFAARESGKSPDEQQPAQPTETVVETEPAAPRPLQPPEGPALLPCEKPRKRSAQLERIAQQADRHIRRGFELGGRKAYFAARTEFIRALRLLAQGLDTERQTTTHSRALAAGLTAVREATDFLPAGSALEADLDIPGIVARHRTPVLKNAQTDNLTPMLALKCYFTFGQEQLAVAAGREVAGSMALHGLGKLHATFAEKQSTDVRAAESKAVVFYQAALLVNSRNAMASNGLGVLLARCGSCAEAQIALKHSLSLCPQSTTWHNLAEVYRQLGDVHRARRADQLAATTRRGEEARRKSRHGTSQQQVRWVDPKTFAQSYAKNPVLRPPGPATNRPTAESASRSTPAAKLPARNPAAPAATGKSKNEPASDRKTLWDWFSM